MREDCRKPSETGRIPTLNVSKTEDYPRGIAFGKRKIEMPWDISLPLLRD
jgi:hypothetical protein